jgi:hypothetical protein
MTVVYRDVLYRGPAAALLNVVPQNQASQKRCENQTVYDLFQLKCSCSRGPANPLEVPLLTAWMCLSAAVGFTDSRASRLGAFCSTQRFSQVPYGFAKCDMGLCVFPTPSLHILISPRRRIRFGSNRKSARTNFRGRFNTDEAINNPKIRRLLL